MDKLSDQSSDVSEESTDAEIADILRNQPMYYVLSQFLETADNKNIASILEELVNEVRQLRVAVENAKKA